MVIHGWRYTAAKQLAEAGATDSQIHAVTGDATPEIVNKYRQQAGRKHLSADAQKLREQNKNETEKIF